MDNNIVIYDGELTHWGIRGMRWGIRRYQNKDGSLTPAGKKKIRAEQAKVREQETINKNRKATQAKIERLNARKKAAADEKAALDEAEGKKVKKGKKSGDDADAAATEEAKNLVPKKKSIKDMTNEELVNAIARKRLENEYERLNPEPVQQGQQAANKSGFMKKVWDEAVVPAAIESGRKLINTAAQKGIEKMFKQELDPNSVEALEKIHKKLDLTQKIDKIKNPDKYLSEEDQTKRNDRRIKNEDREAQMRGFKDAVDEAVYKRQQQKAEADEAARKANESISKEYYDRDYNASYQTTYSSKGSSNVSSSTVSSGQKIVSGYLGSGNNSLATYNPPVSSFSQKTVSRGLLAASNSSGILDRTTMSSLMSSSWDQRSSNPSTVALGERTVAGYLGSGSSTPVLALPAPKDDD